MCACSVEHPLSPFVLHLTTALCTERRLILSNMPPFPAVTATQSEKGCFTKPNAPGCQCDLCYFDELQMCSVVCTTEAQLKLKW